MKKFLAIVLSLIMVISLAACDMEAGYVVGADGSLEATFDIEFSAKEFNDYVKMSYMLSGFEVSNIPEASDDEILEVIAAQGLEATTYQKNGVTWFRAFTSEKVDSFDPEDLGEGIIISKTEFVTTADSEGVESDFTASIDPAMIELLGGMDVTTKVTLPEKIVCTNGKLSSDKKTASWTADVSNPLGAVYAYTASSDELIKINVKSLTNKKKVKVVTNDKVKSVKVNGKAVKGKTINLTDDGKYTIDVVTANATKSFEVVKDSTAPTVKGVENGATYDGSVKIKFSDKSGIKKATLNGKKVKKTGTTAKKTGTNKLVVTDKAGNKSTITFTIK